MAVRTASFAQILDTPPDPARPLVAAIDLAIVIGHADERRRMTWPAPS
jgi:hypothetical protein